MLSIDDIRRKQREKLKKQGWIENEDGNFVPPDSLFKNKPNSFQLFDAMNLQELLEKDN